MPSLQEVISDPKRRSQVVADAAVVLDDEVSDKSGTPVSRSRERSRC